MENVEYRIWKHMSFDIDINPVKSLCSMFISRSATWELRETIYAVIFSIPRQNICKANSAHLCSGDAQVVSWI